MNRILIIGATSAIAEAVARMYAAQGQHLYLLARNAERLQTMAADLKLRGAASVYHAAFEAADFARHREILDDILAHAGGHLDIVLIAHGTLPDQSACEQDFRLALEEFNTNGLSILSLLTHLASQFERQGKGTLAVISSPAGDRGRQSNYVYGAAKAAVSVFLQGLRNRLQSHGVHVLTIKPGFVDTPMTAEFKKGPLWAKPESVAAGILRAIEKKKSVVYLPWFWRWIMLIIVHIPEFIFKRMKL